MACSAKLIITYPSVSLLPISQVVAKNHEMKLGFSSVHGSHSSLYRSLGYKQKVFG